MRGRLRLELTTASGALVETRRASNSVMRSGAMIVAELFAGRGAPITHMAVGTSDAAPEDIGLEALSNEAVGESEPLSGDTATPVSEGSIRFEVDEVKRQVRVRLRATLPANAAIGHIREAGLIARTPGPADGDPPVDRLYNRVTFAPIDKGNDHELTLFWEVEFPFGDLSWAY
jgi:hypothetical protein